MSDIPVDKGEERSFGGRSAVDVEREITKRQMIESVTSIVLVVLYMAYTMLRGRDPGVVALDGSDASNDWSS